MKILFAVRGLFPDFIGGSHRHSYFLIKSLAKLDPQIDVVQPSQKTHFNEFENVHEYYVPYGVNAYTYSKNLARFISNRVYDVGYSDGFSLWIYLKNKKFPCIFNHHGFHMFQRESLINFIKYSPRESISELTKILLRRFICLYVVRNSDYIVSLGGKMTEIIVNKLRGDLDKVIEVPNGIDLGYVERRQTNKRNKIANSFLFVGNLEYRKGLTYLVRALSKLGNVKMIIIGEGPLKAKLKSLSKNGNVEFLGRVSDKELFDWYSKVECFILPSLIEGMPTVILEAMACSLPVIATDVGAVRTMVNEKNGIVVTPGSIEELQRAIEKFSTLNKETKRKMGEKSRGIIEEKFTWDKVAKKFYADLKKIIAFKQKERNESEE